MISQEQEQFYLDLIEKSNRKGSDGRIKPTEEEQNVIIKRAQEGSKYFTDLLGQIADYGGLYPKIFVYVLYALDEDKKRQENQKKSKASLGALPEVGEKASLDITIGQFKPMPWTTITPSGRKETRYTSAAIGYVGEYEIFFWANGKNIKEAELKEGQTYTIVGQVKSVDTTKQKIELTRITSITPFKVPA